MLVCMLVWTANLTRCSITAEGGSRSYIHQIGLWAPSLLEDPSSLLIEMGRPSLKVDSTFLGFWSLHYTSQSRESYMSIGMHLTSLIFTGDVKWQAVLSLCLLDVSAIMDYNLEMWPNPFSPKVCFYHNNRNETRPGPTAARVCAGVWSSCYTFMAM